MPNARLTPGCPTLRAAEFETSERYLAPLRSFRIPSQQYVRTVAYPHQLPIRLIELAQRVAALETGLPVVDVCSLVTCKSTVAENDAACPLCWLSVQDTACSNEWGLYLRDDANSEVVVWFSHETWGYRFESYTHLSKALLRLAQMLSGSLDWLNFGSNASRQSLVRKGQFYWEALSDQRLIPIDNFVFVTTAGLEIRVAGAAGRAVVSVEQPDAAGTFQWVEDYAEGLHLMAELIARSRSIEDFSPVHPSKEGALQGTLIVKSIYDSQDVWSAPVLVFNTGLGQRVSLHTAEPEWEVTYEGPAAAGSSVRLATRQEPAAALCYLADLLSGVFKETDPLFESKTQREQAALG